jgi:hypothetical protein
MRYRSGVVAAVVACGIAIVAACESDRPPCYKGDYQQCNCPNPGGPAIVGYQGCLPTENGFYGCVCTGAPPDAPLAFGTGAFGTACSTGANCVGGYCSEKRCTMPCIIDADCPPAPPAPPAPVGDASDEGGDASDQSDAGADDAGDAGPEHACTSQGLCRTVE